MRTSTKKDTRKSINILQHTIKYYYENGQDMPDHEEEHVKDMIIKGFNSGQLVDFDTEKEQEITGWWEIVFEC